MTLVTRDAMSGQWIPQSAAEFTSLLSGRGIANPGSAYGCQDASGSALDFIGSRNLAAGGTPLYQQAVTGWTSLSLKPRSNTSDYFGGFSAGVDLHSSSALLLMRIRFNAAPGSQSCLVFFGGSGSTSAVMFLTSAGKINIDLNGGAADATGSVNVSNSTIILALKLDITNHVVKAYVDGVESFSPTWQGAFDSGDTDLFMGGVDLNWPDASLLDVAYFTGSGAEIDDAHVAALIDSFQNGPAVSSIAVTPSPVTISTIGATQQMTATATRADSSTYDATATATWSSSDPSKATVSATGLVTAIAIGTATITASFTSLGASAASGTSVCTVSGVVPPTPTPVAPVVVVNGRDHVAEALGRLCAQFRGDS